MMRATTVRTITIVVVGALGAGFAACSPAPSADSSGSSVDPPAGSTPPLPGSGGDAGGSEEDSSGGDSGAADGGSVADAAVSACGHVVHPVAVSAWNDGKVIARGNTFYMLARQGTEIVAVEKNTATPPKAIVPKGGLTIRDFAVDAVSVYYTTQGAVLKCPLTGCAATGPEVVASLQIEPGPIVTNGSDVYYATKTEVLRCAVGGCGSTPTSIAPVVGTIDLALDGVNLYWTDNPTSGDGRVLSCPLAGCGGATKVIADKQWNAAGIATDGARVFWYAANSDLRTCPVSGCVGDPTVLATVGNILGKPFADGKDVYWVAGDRHLYRCAVTGCALMPSIVAQYAGHPVVAVDASGFTYGASKNMQQCPLCGCDGTPTLASGTGVRDLVSVGSKLYWSYWDNNLWEAAIRTCDAANCAATQKLLVEDSFSRHVTPIASGFGFVFDVSGFYGYSGNGDFDSSIGFCPLSGCPSVGGSSSPKPVPLRYDGTPHTLGGAVSGIGTKTVRLINSVNADQITLNADGPFVMPKALPSGSAYSFRIHPDDVAKCSVLGATGVVGYGPVNTILVRCDQNLPFWQGAITGWLTGPLTFEVAGVQMTLPGGNRLDVRGSDNWTVVAMPLPVGATGPMKIISSPANLSCTPTSKGIDCVGGFASGLTSDGAFFYWVSHHRDLPTRGAVMKMPIGGGMPTVLASDIVGAGRDSSVVLDATHVYFSASTAGTVAKVPKAGGAVTLLATGLTKATSLVLDGQVLYLLADGRVHRMDLSAPGAVPMPITPSGTVGKPLIVAGSLFWTSGASVWRSSPTGANPLEQASGPGFTGALTMNGTKLFFGSPLLSIP